MSKNKLTRRAGRTKTKYKDTQVRRVRREDDKQGNEGKHRGKKHRGEKVRGDTGKTEEMQKGMESK